jgi:putative RNA 2'-phosphotransferase
MSQLSSSVLPTSPNVKPNKTILLLEDNDERLAGFERTVKGLGEFELKIWRDAPSMIAECEAFFPTTALMSLDDLNSQPGATVDPGTGLEVAKYLDECRPVCPVIIHSTNADRAHSMHNELRFADWISERVGPIGTDWIETLWMTKSREFLSTSPNTWPAALPADHEERLRRALLSLDGLSVGDGFGECFFSSPSVIERRLEHRDPPPPPWFVTDDNCHGKPLTLDQLKHIVATSDKKRFALSEDGARIRGNQGHSVEVDLQYAPQIPPEILYHGTATRFLDSTRQHGLQKMDRHDVHLSAETKVTLQIGGRHGKPGLIIVRAGEMHRAGHEFRCSANGVWLVAHVPPQFIEFPEPRDDE